MAKKNKPTYNNPIVSSESKTQPGKIDIHINEEWLEDQDLMCQILDKNFEEFEKNNSHLNNFNNVNVGDLLNGMMTILDKSTKEFKSAKKAKKVNKKKSSRKNA